MKRRISIDNGHYIPSIEQLCKDIDTVIMGEASRIDYPGCKIYKVPQKLGYTVRVDIRIKED